MEVNRNQKLELEIKVDTTELDVAIEKIKKLKEVVKEIKNMGVSKKILNNMLKNLIKRQHELMKGECEE